MYSEEIWDKTSDGRKRMHQISNCECCRTTATIFFPLARGHKKREPFTKLQEKAAKSINMHHIKPLKKEVKRIGQEIYSSFNKVCEENLGQSFSSVLCQVPDANLQMKASSSERKKKNREVKRKFKKSIEEKWERNDVDSHLQQRISFKSREVQRFNQSFETIKDAQQRVTEAEHKEKRHSPKAIAGDLEELVNDFHTWTPGTPVNWTAKARQFNINKTGGDKIPKNVGQILKDYLKDQGLDITPFEREGAGICKIITLNKRFLHNFNSLTE